MKTLAKKIIPVVLILCLLCSAFAVNTMAAGSSIAFSKQKLTIGETVTVTVRMSAPSGDKIYGLSGFLTYDPAILEFVSGENCNQLTKGKIKMIIAASSNTVTQTVKLKAIAAGKSIVAAESITYEGNEPGELSLDGSSATVTVTNPSAQASSDATLRNLSVSAGTLTPAFHPEVTSYNVTIENSVTELWLQASKSDPNQTYTVEGSKDMKVGYNKRVVTVTAENGNTKVYTVNIIRLDENGNPPSEGIVDTPINDVIEVDVNGTTMYVGEDFSTQTLPQSFSVIDYAFDGKTIPALSDNHYVLVFLTMPDGSDSGFYVVNKDGSFARLVTIDLYPNMPFYVLPTDKVPVGYKAVEDYEIGGIPVPAYKSTADSASDFFLVYAKGPGGQSTFYRFDTIDQTLQRATGLSFDGEGKESDKNDDLQTGSDNIVDNFVSLNLNGKIVAITILAVMLILLAVIILLIVKIATAGKNKEYDYEEEEYKEEDDSAGFEFIDTNDSASDADTEDSVEELFEEETPDEENGAEEPASETSEEETSDQDSDSEN